MSYDSEMTPERVAELRAVAGKATPGPWIAAAKPSSIVGWPVVARRHGRLICNLAWVSPSAERSKDPDVQAFHAEVAGNALYIAAFDPPTAIAMCDAITRLTAERDEARKHLNSEYHARKRAQADAKALREAARRARYELASGWGARLPSGHAEAIAVIDAALARGSDAKEEGEGDV